MRREPAADSHGDRRRTFRADVDGCAIVHGPDGVAIRCCVVDLCLGGVRLAELRSGAGWPPGTAVELDLECSGSGWVTQRGKVVRHRGGHLAIVFDALAPEVEDRIEDEVLGALEAARAPRVVVVDRTESRRRPIADALRSVGCCALEAATPLEAISLIEKSRNHVCAIAIADALTQTQADELIEYLRDCHPDLVVASIVDEAALRGHRPTWEVLTVLRQVGEEVAIEPVREFAEQLRTQRRRANAH